MLRYLILGITYAFAAAAQPGPFQTYIISQSLSKGWRRTLPAALAPIFSDVPIIILVLFLLSRVPGWLAPVLQFAGGIFLIYLAYGAYQTWRSFDTREARLDQTHQQTILKAVTVNLLNPNPYLAWSLVLGPLLLKGWRETPANGIALLAGFYIVLISCTAGIILLFAAARNLGPRVNRVMVGISAIGLACFGFYELWLGISSYAGLLG
jgi:threonine/homoserine/homoserine lactone efflux protein